MEENIAMKNPKQSIMWEDLILHEHAEHLKLTCYLQQKQHSHDNIQEHI